MDGLAVVWGWAAEHSTLAEMQGGGGEVICKPLVVAQLLFHAGACRKQVVSHLHSHPGRNGISVSHLGLGFFGQRNIIYSDESSRDRELCP